MLCQRLGQIYAALWPFLRLKPVPADPAAAVALACKQTHARCVYAFTTEFGWGQNPGQMSTTPGECNYTVPNASVPVM